MYIHTWYPSVCVCLGTVIRVCCVVLCCVITSWAMNIVTLAQFNVIHVSCSFNASYSQGIEDWNAWNVQNV